MPIQLFRAQDFRCLEQIEFEADPNYNLIVGPNASGKTSLLEALAYLGRGKSFRGAYTNNLIRHGAHELVLFGRVQSGGHTASVGVRNSRDGLQVRIDGENAAGGAALAETLPLQIIDPDVHNLVSGSPEQRRRYLDWLAFHVEPGFLPNWRHFRRTLKQRNAALRAGGRGLDSWNAEFVELGLCVDRARRAALGQCTDALQQRATELLGCDVGFEYGSGWGSDKTLGDALAGSRARDLHLGATQVGPQRADIKLLSDNRQARKLVSRGQQKLLACSMVLAATEIVQAHLGSPMLLLLDDPAAELDPDSLTRLMNQVFGLNSQVVATALDQGALNFPETPSTFHVKQGVLRRG